MTPILACLTEQHLLLPVLLAGLICLGTAVATVLLLPRRTPGSRAGRLRVTLAPALSLGAGAWSTHFVAMLAYDPSLPIAFEVGATVLSFALAVVGSFVSLLVWVRARTPSTASRAAPWPG